MADLSAFATGLGQSINNYLGQNIQQQKKQQNDAFDQAQAQQTHAVEAQGDLSREGKVTPDMAEELIPGSGKWIQSFQQSNGRLPTIKETSTGLDSVKEKLMAIAAKTSAGASQMKIEKQLTDYQKMYNNDKVISGEKNAYASADTALDQIHLAVSNPVAYSSVPITLARMLTGTSRINVQEIQRLGGSQAITDKASQIASQMGSGTLTQDNAAWMEDVVNTLKTAHQTNIENRGVELASQYRQVSSEDLPTAYQKVTGGAIPQRFTEPPSQHPNLKVTSMADKKALLRKKLGL